MGPAIRENKYSEAVEASVASSLLAGSVLGAFGALTLLVMTLTPMGSWVRGVLGMAVALACAEAIRVSALRRGARGVCWFRIGIGGTVEVRNAAGHPRGGVLRAGCFVAPWLTVVRWRPAGAWFDRTFVLLPGMLDPESFRRLRVLLRWA